MNIAKLKGKIVEREMNADTMAKAIGVDRGTWYRKMRSCEKFTIGEAQKIKKVLELTNEEASEIFLP